MVHNKIGLNNFYPNEKGLYFSRKKKKLMIKLSTYVIILIILGSVAITTVLADTVTVNTYPYQIPGLSSTGLSVASSGNVGIGTNNPVPLVSTVNSENVNKILRVDGLYSNSIGGVEICCRNGGMGGMYATNGGLWVNVAGNSWGGNNNIIFATDQNNNEYLPTEKMRITSIGNVGIGTIPSQKLDVNGTIRVTGNIVSPNDICIGTC